MAHAYIQQYDDVIVHMIKHVRTTVLEDIYRLNLSFPLCMGHLSESGKNKMQPTNPNAHTYVNGDDVEKHGHAVMQSTFLKQFIYTVLYM